MMCFEQKCIAEDTCSELVRPFLLELARQMILDGAL